MMLRSVFGALVLFALCWRAADAQDWRSYALGDAGITVDFPGEPHKTNGAYPTPVSVDQTVSAPSTTYSIRQGGSLYTALVADVSKAGVDGPRLMQSVAMALRTEGEVQLDEPVSISGGQCGRYLGIVGPDHSQVFLAILMSSDAGRLFVLKAEVQPGDVASDGPNALRFQQSANLTSIEKPRSAPTPADARAWTQYDYDDVGFGVKFPAAPSIESGRYWTDDGLSVPALRYTVRSGRSLYRVTVADLWRTPADRNGAIDQAVDVLRRYGEIRSDRAVSIPFGQCGRDLSLAKPAGDYASVGVYFPTSQHKLFIVEATGSEADRQAQAQDVDMFRQSFRLAKYPESKP